MTTEPCAPILKISLYLYIKGSNTYVRTINLTSNTSFMVDYNDEVNGILTNHVNKIHMTCRIHKSKYKK